MNIQRSRVTGYCMGVRKAIQEATSSLALHKDKKVFTLGPLIHNSSALRTLEEKGLRILEEKDVKILDKDCVIVIRAHGVSPFVMQQIQQTGALVIDATCPRVMSNQQKAKEYAKKGYFVFIAGDKNHAEVKGIEGFAKQGFMEGKVKNQVVKVLSCKKEARYIQSSDAPCVILSQTTIAKTEYEKIATALKQRLCNLCVLDTICPATQKRQEALIEMKQKVQGMIVVGGKNSSNTKRLYSIAKSLFPFACHIENETQIPKDFFSLESVGITSGASTQDSEIDAVAKRLEDGSFK